MPTIHLPFRASVLSILSMRKTAALALFLAAMFAASTPALADCYQVADQEAARYGAEVVSVREKGGNCIIKLLMPSQGGQPPRVEIITRPG